MLLHESDIKSSAPRIEYKYFVPAWVRTQLLNDFGKFCRDDKHSEGRPGGYTVSSIYFENLALKSYQDKLEGKSSRFKLRVRFYPDAGNHDQLQIELKHKHTDRIMKSQTRISRALFSDLLRGDFSEVAYIEDSTLNHFYRLVKVNGFRPSCRIDYMRKAYFARTDPRVRITLDHDVRCSRFSSNLDAAPGLRVTTPGTGILEMKSPGHLPFWTMRIIGKYSLKRAAISKYAAAVRVLAENAVPVRA